MLKVRWEVARLGSAYGVAHCLMLASVARHCKGRCLGLAGTGITQTQALLEYRNELTLTHSHAHTKTHTHTHTDTRSLFHTRSTHMHTHAHAHTHTHLTLRLLPCSTGQRLEAARLGATLLAAPFTASITHPQRPVGFATYVPRVVWDGVDLFTDTYKCVLGWWIMQTLNMLWRNLSQTCFAPCVRAAWCDVGRGGPVHRR